MDPNIHTPTHRRILYVRLAIRCSRAMFAPLIDAANAESVRRMEDGRCKFHYKAKHLQRLRLLERAYADRLEEYNAVRKKRNTAWVWGKERKVYGKWDGEHCTRTISPYVSHLPLPKGPDAGVYIQALGGMEVFRNGYGERRGRGGSASRAEGEDAGGVRSKFGLD